jgi:hypothetical protein
VRGSAKCGFQQLGQFADCRSAGQTGPIWRVEFGARDRKSAAAETAAQQDCAVREQRSLVPLHRLRPTWWTERVRDRIAQLDRARARAERRHADHLAHATPLYFPGDEHPSFR